MAHIACITLPYLGHINPMTALARELERRGHLTTFFGIAEIGPLFARFGLDFVAVGRRTHPPGWVESAKSHLGRVDGILRLGPVMRDFAGLSAMLCDELPDALRARSVDLILADQYEAAGGMVSYHLGLPFVSLAAALPLNWDDSVPSPFVGWRHGETRWHRWRNVGGAFAAKRIREPISAVIDAYAARWRLVQGRQIEHYMSGLAQIAQLVPNLDFPRRALIGCFHYCGPLRDRPPAASSGRPSTRAFASLGTLQGHRGDLFSMIAQTSEDCGLDLTLAHGGRLPAHEASRLARQADVQAYVPQDKVLAGCDVAILHGGLNTVLDALAAGVPLVVLPLAFEQSAIAARVQRSGAGMVLGRHRVGRRNLARLITQVRHDPSFKTAAQRLRDEIAAAGGVGRAGDIVEHVLTTGRPCLSAAIQNTPGFSVAPRPASANDVPASG